MHTAHALLIGRLQDKKNLIGLIFLVFFGSIALFLDSIKFRMNESVMGVHVEIVW